MIFNKNYSNDNPLANVVVELIPDTMDINKYVDANEKGVKEQSGFIILNKRRDLVIDTLNQTAITTYTDSTNPQINIVQKYILLPKSRTAYVITLSHLPPHSKLSETLKKELNGILNSFQLIQ